MVLCAHVTLCCVLGCLVSCCVVWCVYGLVWCDVMWNYLEDRLHHGAKHELQQVPHQPVVHGILQNVLPLALQTVKVLDNAHSSLGVIH